MSKEYKTKVLIIGSGAAGCTAAIYAARANLQPILVTGMNPGGQLTITTDVENYPGFENPIEGPWLMEQMRKQAERSGTIVIEDEINYIEPKQYPFKCISIFESTYIAQSVIIATGAQAKWLGIESEKNFTGYGVSACATCDGAFFKGKDVAVIGGGNTAVEEALFLTRHAKKVFLIHRRDKLRAEAVMQERLFSNAKIKVIWNSVVDEIIGIDKPYKKVTGVRIKSTVSEEVKVIDVEGIFIAIGHTPNTDVFKYVVKCDDSGYIINEKGSTLTSCPGIFCAGDVHDKIYRQAVVAAGSGCMAALDAERFLNSKDL